MTTSAECRLGLPLTARELQVLTMLAEGWSQAAIAGQLHFALTTIKADVLKLSQKLGARSRPQAVALGYQYGYLALPSAGSATPSPREIRTAHRVVEVLTEFGWRLRSDEAEVDALEAAARVEAR